MQFVDYGNREEVAIRDCQELPAQFHRQPYQALRLVLAGVQRPAEGWNEDIECAFRVGFIYFVLGIACLSCAGLNI